METTAGVYRELYYKLFGTMVDAVESLEQDNCGIAKQLLIAAMQEAEERVIASEEPINPKR